jgi:hypothetical protein
MNIFKVIIAASIALASPAAAETWELGQSGDWTVKMSESINGDLLCGMMSLAPSGHVFNISVDAVGVYHLMISNNGAEVPNRAPVFISIDLEISSPTMYEEWVLNDAELGATDNIGSVYFVIGADPHQRDFIQDFMQGDDIDLMGSNSPYATWSLNGSAHAVTLLDTCRQRIMGDL